MLFAKKQACSQQPTEIQKGQSIPLCIFLLPYILICVENKYSLLIKMYGKDLSSRRIILNRGLCRFIRLHSNKRASISVLVTKKFICFVILPIRCNLLVKLLSRSVINDTLGEVFGFANIEHFCRLRFPFDKRPVCGEVF